MKWSALFILLISLLTNLVPAAGQDMPERLQRIGSTEQLLSFIATDTITTDAALQQFYRPGKAYGQSYRTVALYVALGNQAIARQQTTEGYRQYEKAILIAQQLQSGLVEGYLHYKIGRILYERGTTVNGVEHLLYARELIGTSGYTSIPGCGSFLAFMGSMYSDYEDYTTGLQYLHGSLKYPFLNLNDEYYAYGTLGLVYYKLDKPDSSIRASAAALGIARKMNNPVAVGEMSGNLGAGYLQRGSYDSAFFYLSADYRTSSSLQNWQSATGALLKQVSIQLIRKDVAAAETILKRIDSIFLFCHCTSTFSDMAYYGYQVKLNRLKGNYKQAFQFQDSVDHLFNLYQNQPASLRNLELTTTKRVKEARIDLLESEKKREQVTRNLLIALLALSAVIFLQVLYRKNQRQKNEKQVYELKLRSSEQQLKTYLDSIREKNQILEELTEELSRRKTDLAPLQQEETDWDILVRIKNASLLTEQDWQEFVQLVNVVHPYFFVKLERKIPGLTPSETRLLTLIKLNLSNKEMAAMLGISTDSVTKSKQRAKKKLLINPESALTIEEVVSDI